MNRSQSAKVLFPSESLKLKRSVPRGISFDPLHSVPTFVITSLVFVTIRPFAKTLMVTHGKLPAPILRNCPQWSFADLGFTDRLKRDRLHPSITSNSSRPFAISSSSSASRSRITFGGSYSAASYSTSL